MSPPIGFALISHNKPHQLQRLVGKLNAMFDRPPIAVHHDFSQCALSPDQFPENVSFVRPHLKTGWGQFPIVEATVRVIELLYAAPANPDCFVLLSVADYPIKPAARILADLRAGDFDAHIHYELIRADSFKTNWQRMCHRRYCSLNFPPLAVAKMLHTRWPMFTLKNPRLTKRFLPFSDNFNCYAGGHWFCANRRAANYILEFYRSNPKLAAHYRKTMFPEESYFQTVLANAPDLKLNNNHWRYMDWSAGGAHPKTLGMADLPKILSSPHHFARKFDLDGDAAVLDELDGATM